MVTYKLLFDQKIKMLRLLEKQHNEIQQLNLNIIELTSMLNFTEQQLSQAYKTIEVLQSQH